MRDLSGAFEQGDGPGLANGEFGGIRVVRGIPAGRPHRSSALRPGDRVERLRKTGWNRAEQEKRNGKNRSYLHSLTVSHSTHAMSRLLLFTPQTRLPSPPPKPESPIHIAGTFHLPQSALLCNPPGDNSCPTTFIARELTCQAKSCRNSIAAGDWMW
jgi:hypothetical protein